MNFMKILVFVPKKSMVFNAVKTTFFNKSTQDFEIHEVLRNIDSHFTNYYKNDQKNLEILKDLIFRLYLTMNKRGKPESFLIETREILKKIDEKTIRPFLNNREIQISLEKTLIDLLKMVFIFKLKENEGFYQNFNRLLEIYMEKSLKEFKKNDVHINKLITLINIAFNRLLACKDSESIKSFENIRTFISKNLEFYPLEALVSFNIILKEENLYEKYRLELPMESIKSLIYHENYEKLALVLVRLNKSGIDRIFQENIRPLFVSDEKIINKIDPKTISLLITTNFIHKKLFSSEEIEKIYFSLKKSSNSIGFLEISMILTAFSKGKALNQEKLIFFSQELEFSLLKTLKMNNSKAINNMNYHSCVNLLNIFSHNLNENSLKSSLFNDLNFILNSHNLKGINKPEILSIYQSNAIFLRRIRKNPNFNERTIEESRNRIAKVLKKFKPFSNENYDNSMIIFTALVQLKDTDFQKSIANLFAIIKAELKPEKNLINKQLINSFSMILELNSLENKTDYEKSYIPILYQLIEAKVWENLRSFFLIYQETLNFLVIVSINRENIRNKAFYNEIERIYIENIEKFSFLENSYLAFPLVKFALFESEEIAKIEAFYRKAIFIEENHEKLEVLLYNVLMNYTQENQFSEGFFIEMEDFLIKRVLTGDLKEKVQLDGKLKVFSILGRYEIKSRTLLEEFVKLLRENKEKIKLFEWMNALNVLIINGHENLDIFNEILDFIEKSLDKINEKDEFYVKNLSLAKLLDITLKTLYKDLINIEKYPKFLAFSQKDFPSQNLSKNRFYSHFQKTIGTLLKEMEIAFEEEKTIGPFIVDFFIKPDICFEINGRNHYINEKRLNRSTSRKYLVLEKMGYKVKTLEPGLWNKIEKDDKKSEFMREILLKP